jgi:hypothetical protein
MAKPKRSKKTAKQLNRERGVTRRRRQAPHDIHVVPGMAGAMDVDAHRRMHSLAGTAHLWKGQRRPAENPPPLPSAASGPTGPTG